MGKMDERPTQRHIVCVTLFLLKAILGNRYGTRVIP